MRLIVSFHTPDPLYAHSANYLRSSVERLKLPHAIVERPKIGNWARNNHLKPQTIREYHRGGKHGILWIDSDSVVWVDPWPVIDIVCDGADVGVVWHRFESPNGDRRRCVFASTVYFAPTARAAACLDDWIERCERHAAELRWTGLQPIRRAIRGLVSPVARWLGMNVPDEWSWRLSDQPHLQHAIEHHEREHGLVIAELPRNLAYIHDIDRIAGTPPPEVIEAFQASYVGRVLYGRGHDRGIARTNMPGMDHSISVEDLVVAEIKDERHRVMEEWARTSNAPCIAGSSQG